MPKAVAKTVPSPAYSSDSSLSSAPESEDFAVEDTATSTTVDQTRAIALLQETTVAISQPKKRRRAEETTEAEVPAKRAKRVTVTTSSYKEAEEGEEETANHIKTSEAPPKKRGQSAKASTANIKSTAVKTEVEEDIDTVSKGAVKRVRRKTTIEVGAITEEEQVPNSLKRSRKRTKASTETKEEEQASSPSTPKKSRKVKKTVSEEQDVAEEGLVDETPKKAKRKRKTKEEKEAEAMPLAARATGLKIYLGAHVSGAKGVHNAVTNCVHIGGNAFALFLKSQRKWENPPLQEEHKSLFRAACGEHGYDAASHVLPHGSYLVNLAQEDPDRAKQSYDTFLEDLHRCEALGIKLYNFHPGNTGPSPRPTAIARIAHALNRAHASTSTVTPLLENMAGAGNVIGSRFEDLRDIIALVHDRSRIGVCLDTCHALAAGYDLRTPSAFAATLAEFDRVVGMQYLRALHLNDSKAPLGSRRDLHQNIGLGFLGLRAFHNVVNEGRFEGLPMVLETPIEVRDAEGKVREDRGVWAREIKLLEGLVGVDAEGEEFGRLERELSEKGREEREKFLEGLERREEVKRRKEERKRERAEGKGRVRGKGSKKTKTKIESKEDESDESAGSESAVDSRSGSGSGSE